MFFIVFFSVKLVGKDGILSCSGEPCSGTFNSFYIISVWFSSLQGETVSLFCAALSLLSLLQQ